MFHEVRMGKAYLARGRGRAGRRRSPLGHAQPRRPDQPGAIEDPPIMAPAHAPGRRLRADDRAGAPAWPRREADATTRHGGLLQRPGPMVPIEVLTAGQSFTDDEFLHRQEPSGRRAPVAGGGWFQGPQNVPRCLLPAPSRKIDGTRLSLTGLAGEGDQLLREDGAKVTFTMRLRRTGPQGGLGSVRIDTARWRSGGNGHWRNASSRPSPGASASTRSALLVREFRSPCCRYWSSRMTAVDAQRSKAFSRPRRSPGHARGHRPFAVTRATKIVARGRGDGDQEPRPVLRRSRQFPSRSARRGRGPRSLPHISTEGASPEQHALSRRSLPNRLQR